MAKIKLKLLESYRFQYSTEIKVRDVNYGGHLGNDALVAMLQEARLHLLRDIGCTELDLGDSQTGIIMNDLVVNYRSEGFMFDKITIHSEISELKAASFRISHKVMRDDDILALAEVGLVAFDYKDKRIAVIPDGFIERLE